MNRHIGSKRYSQAKIWDILRPGKTQAGMWDAEAEIWNVPGNTGWLASLQETENQGSNWLTQVYLEKGH